MEFRLSVPSNTGMHKECDDAIALNRYSTCILIAAMVTVILRENMQVASLSTGLCTPGICTRVQLLLTKLQ